MMMMGGMMIGSLAAGSLSALLGRKNVLIVGIAGHFCCSIATAFVKSYLHFVVLRVLITFFGPVMFLPAFLIGIEIVGPSKRTLAGVVMETFWVVGMFILTGVAYGLRQWNDLQIALSVPTVLLLIYILKVPGMVYYGLSLNIGSLYGDIYVNVFLSALVELASYIFCLLFLNVLGRKPLQCATMLIGGVACMCTLFPVIYDAPGWVTVVMSLIGKFCASAEFAIIDVYSAELFPTVMRNSGMGLGSFSARIGGILAPYIADIGNIIEGKLAVALPLIIFGVVSISAGLLALLLPETVNRKLPDTVEDAKHIGKEDRRGKNSYTLTDLNLHTSRVVTEGTLNPSFTLDGQNK